jgi:hypothetical protein
VAGLGFLSTRSFGPLYTESEISFLRVSCEKGLTIGGSSLLVSGGYSPGFKIKDLEGDIVNICSKCFLKF